jgi:hypothetical protein
MPTDEVLKEMAEALERLASHGRVVLGISDEAEEMVTWDFTPEQAQELAASLRAAAADDDLAEDEDEA